MAFPRRDLRERFFYVNFARENKNFPSRKDAKTAKPFVLTKTNQPISKNLRVFAASRENKNFPSRKDAKIAKFIPLTRSQGEKPPL